MTFRVHALLVSEIVSTLYLIAGSFSGACSRERAYYQPGSCARRRAIAAADGSARRRADCGTDRGALHSAVARGLGGCGAAYLPAGKLPAVKVVCTKLVEAFPGTGQHHDTRPVWHRRARAHQERRQQRRESQWVNHGLGTRTFSRAAAAALPAATLPGIA